LYFLYYYKKDAATNSPEGPMHYERACRLLTARRPHEKKVAHQTWAKREPCSETPLGNKTTQDAIAIKFYSTEILRFYPDDSVRVRLQGRTGGRQTQDRVQRFLWGCRLWAMSEDRLRSRRYSVLHTPKGSRPLMGDCVFDPEWNRTDLDVVNTVDATQLYRWVHEYSVEYSKRLAFRKLVDVVDCKECSHLANEKHTRRHNYLYNLCQEIDFPLERHLFEHVRGDAYPPALMRLALHNGYPGRDERSMLELLPSCLSKKTRHKPTEQEVLEGAEAMLLYGRPPEGPPQPHEHRRNYRIVLRDFLLQHLGFEA
jgi:hypothetical protein